MGISNEQQLPVYHALVKDLNPQKKNWDLLVEGETIRLPLLGAAAESRALASREKPRGKAEPEQEPTPVSEAAKPGVKTEMTRSPSSQPKAPAEIAARDHLALVARVMESIGNEVERDGEEVVALKEGSVRLEKHSFPLVYNRKLNQKIILDPDDKIPPPLRAQLISASESTTAVFSLSRSVSVQKAVSQLLARLGYQSLSTDQPIMLQQGGLSFEARGDWMVLAPEVSHKRQEVFIINIGDDGSDMPEYLRSQLGLSGVHFRNLPSPVSSASPTVTRPPQASFRQPVPVHRLLQDRASHRGCATFF